MCLTWISTPDAGAFENKIPFDDILYAFVPSVSLGCWTTPSRVTRTLVLFGGILERLNSVVVPSPVNVSILKSTGSKLLCISAITCPQNTSLAELHSHHCA